MTNDRAGAPAPRRSQVSPSRIPPSRSRRAELSPEQLVADIAARVRRVAPDMPADALDALARRMAAVELKYRDRHTPTWLRTPLPPRT